jgi:hypothetical protein
VRPLLVPIVARSASRYQRAPVSRLTCKWSRRAYWRGRSCHRGARLIGGVSPTETNHVDRDLVRYTRPFGALGRDRGRSVPDRPRSRGNGRQRDWDRGPSAAEINHARIAAGTFDRTTRRVHIRLDSPADAEADEHMVLEGDVTPDAIRGRFEYGRSGSGGFELRRIPQRSRPRGQATVVSAAG